MYEKFIDSVLELCYQLIDYISFSHRFRVRCTVFFFHKCVHIIRCEKWFLLRDLIRSNLN